MIFVVTGTQNIPFDRAVKAVIDLASHLEKERFVLQVGPSAISCNLANVEIYKYLSAQEYQQYLINAEVVICHGGSSAIFSALSQRKKLVVIPREVRFGEHNDDHQLELAQLIRDKNLGEVCQDVSSLKEVVDRVINTSYRAYESSSASLVSSIRSIF